MGSGKTNVIGIIAIVIGIMLVAGGSMFLLVTSLSSDFPRLLVVPPIIQIILGVLASISGFFMYRGNTTAKFVLLFVAFGVFANLGLLGLIAFRIIST